MQRQRESTMNQEELFSEQLAELRELAKNNGGAVSVDDVKEAFSEMELDDAQVKLILDYLKENTKIKISGGDFAESEEDAENYNISGEDSKYIAMYLEELKELPPVSDGKKRALFMSAMNGEKQAKEELILALLPQVVDIAKMYAGQGVPMEDLIGEGNVALAMSMDVIEQEETPEDAESMSAGMVMRAMEEMVSEDSLSKDAFEAWAERANEVLDKARELSEELLRKITIEELCSEAGFEKEFVMEVLEITGSGIEYLEIPESPKESE